MAARLKIAPKIYCRKPHSVTAEGSVETAAGPLTLGSDIQHPTEDYAFISDGGVVRAVNISNRSAPAIGGTDGSLVANLAIAGMAFDSTGRYLYVTDGATTLAVHDLGAAFADIDSPDRIGTDADLSQGNGLHCLNRIGSNLYTLADTATNNSFQVYSVSSPSNPALSSTTAMTGHDIEALIGHPNTALDTILYSASDTSGKVLVVPIASPGSFTVLQLPTFAGLQIRCTSGIVFSPDDDWMVLPCFILNGTIHHYFWLVYDVSAGYSTALAHCASEDVVNGAIASLRSPIICSEPCHPFSQGMSWNDGNDVLHIATAIRDDSFGESGELRFYAWGAGGDFSRVPRQSGAVSIPGTYSIRARNDGAAKNEWLCAGVSADRTNIIVALATSDLLKSAPNYAADWYNLTPDVAAAPTIEVEYGISGSGPRDRVAQPGTLTFELDNSQFNSAGNLGGYSPDSASPITEDFVDGSSVILTADYGAGAKRTFYGVIETIGVVPGLKGTRRVRVIVTDGLDVLHRTNVALLPLRSNITTEEALRTLWDRVPYAVGTETLTFDAEEGSFIHDYVFDRAYDERTKIIEEVKRLAVVSRGFFYHRHYDGGGMRYTSLDAYLRASVYFNGSATVLLDSPQLREMEPERQESNVYNSVTVRYYPRRVETNSPATTTLFEMEDRVRIGALETITIDAQYRDPGGKASRISGTDIIYPVVATDYTLRPQKNGGGTNLNSQLSVSVEIGATGSRVIASNAGPLPGWFKTKIRGNAIYTQEPLEVTVQDADSITQHKFREYPGGYDALYVANEDDARALANAILSSNKDPRTFIRSATFAIDDSGPTVSAATGGPTRKVGVQEQVTGLQVSDYWVIGTGKLDDTAGSDSADLYGLDVYTIQKVRLTIESLGLAMVRAELVPEDMAFHIPGWIDPKNDWNTGEPNTKTLMNLHLEDNVNALWHDKKATTGNLTKTSNITFDDIPGAIFDVKAGETWQFLLGLFVDSNTTPDAKVTVVAIADDASGTTVINSLVSGRFGLWAPGFGIGDASTTTFGGALAWAIASADEETALLSVRVRSPVDCTVRVQGAQNTSDAATTTFRTSSPLIAFRVEAP